MPISTAARIWPFFTIFGRQDHSTIRFLTNLVVQHLCLGELKITTGWLLTFSNTFACWRGFGFLCPAEGWSLLVGHQYSPQGSLAGLPYTQLECGLVFRWPQPLSFQIPGCPLSANSLFVGISSLPSWARSKLTSTCCPHLFHGRIRAPLILTNV